MNANRRKIAAQFQAQNGWTPKQAYDAIKPLKIKGYRKPKPGDPK